MTDTNPAPTQPPHRTLLARLEQDRAKALRNPPLCRGREARWVNEGMAAAHRIDAAHVLAVFEGPEAAREYMQRTSLETVVARTATPAPDVGLREQYAEAIRALIEGGTLVDLDEKADMETLAEAVLAVRDRHVQRLEAELDRFHAAESADAAAGSYAHRAERVEATLDQVREYVETSDDDGIRTRETVLRLLGNWGVEMAEGVFVPPPPGSTVEQLPADVLALIDPAPYLSTACGTAQALEEAAAEHPGRSAGLLEWAGRLHRCCRENQKFTGRDCACGHHEDRG